MNPKLKLTGTNAIFLILGHSSIFDTGFESVLSEMIFFKQINKKGAEIRSVYLKAYVTYV